MPRPGPAPRCSVPVVAWAAIYHPAAADSSDWPRKRSLQALTHRKELGAASIGLRPSLSGQSTGLGGWELAGYFFNAGRRDRVPIVDSPPGPVELSRISCRVPPAIGIPKRRNVLAVTTYRTNSAYLSLNISLSFWAEENMSISITAQSHLHQHPGVWLGAKLALALVAILLLSLTAAGLETRYGVAPSADSAMLWVLFGE
jgi:hypothetical protein